MRVVMITGLVLLLAVVGLVLVSMQTPARAAQPNMYEGLRAQALSTKLADLGLDLPADKPIVYGVVMDMGLAQGTATLVAFSTGDASLYLSTGGGVIGGGAHDAVRRAARAWIEQAQAHLGALSPTTRFDRPGDGQARFFVLTNRGVLTTTVSEAEVNAGKLEMSPVWYGGQQLLADLHRSTEKAPD